VAVDFDHTRILDGVSLRVDAGEWLSIVGPNGAGKSTLLRAIAGLVPARGEIELDGRPAGHLRRRDRARLTALVPQAPVVPPGMTVADYVVLGRTPHIPFFGAESAHDLAVAERTMAQLDLLAFAERTVSSLSGGERQRVFLARALAQEAPVLLLDEPTTGLDVGYQQQVLELIDRLRRDHTLTVLSTMHDLTLAGQYADRLVLLDGGRVVSSGPAAEVLTEDNIARSYGAHVRVVHHDGQPVVLPFRAIREPTG
jgi:iron complex transport system ATP-binding protein